VLEPVDAAENLWAADASPAGNEPETEVEPATFTLDEFMAKREQARQKLDSLVSSKERSVDKEAAFAGLVQKNSGELDNYMPGKLTQAQQAQAKKERGAKQILDLNFAFKQNPQPEFKPRDREQRPERAGRGGGRGRGEGRPRQYEKRERPDTGADKPAFSSVDFPSL
jgi:hypothetical protein